MLNDFFTDILNFKEYMLICTAVVVIAAIIVWLQGKEFAITPRRFKVYRVFMLLNGRSRLLMALLASRYIYFLTLLLFLKPIGSGEFFALLILVIPYEIISGKLKQIIIDVSSSITIIAAITIYSVLHQYLATIYLDIEILIVAIVLGIFIFLYSTYWLLVSARNVIRMKDERGSHEIKQEEN